MSAVQDYLKSNKERQLSELLDFLRIPSVSADPKFAKDVRRTAEFVKKSLLDAGAGKAEIHDTPGHPIVYAE